MGEIEKNRGKAMKELTMKELMAVINSYEEEEFILHVEFAEEVRDGQE